MENKIATPLANLFFNNKKTVLQCSDETLGSTAETLVIQFDQEKFEQLLSEGGSSPINVRRHRKISMARSPLAMAWKEVPDGMKNAVCLSLNRDWISFAPTQHTACEAKSASKALWIEIPNSALCKANGSPISALTEAHVVSNCETTSALHRSQLHFSCESKGKSLTSASS